MDEFKTGDRVEVSYDHSAWHTRIYLCKEGGNHWAYDEGYPDAYKWSFVRHSRKPAPDLPVDHPVWVRDDGDDKDSKYASLLSSYPWANGKCWVWSSGRHSHTSGGDITPWDQYSLDSKTWYSAETHEEVEP